jgi:hypothetical protein
MGWFDSSALATTTSTPPRATMKSQYTKGLMNDLHECCRIIAHTADDPVRSLQTLLAMCVNVYEHPDDERYRHIRLSNDRFHRRVWDVPGGRDACDRLGWVETVQHDGEPCVILPWNEKVPGAVCKYLRLAIEDALSDAEADARGQGLELVPRERAPVDVLLLLHDRRHELLVLLRDLDVLRLGVKEG